MLNLQGPVGLGFDSRAHVVMANSNGGNAHDATLRMSGECARDDVEHHVDLSRPETSGAGQETTGAAAAFRSEKHQRQVLVYIPA